MKYLYLVDEGHGVLLSGEVDPVPCPFLPGDGLTEGMLALLLGALPSHIAPVRRNYQFGPCLSLDVFIGSLATGRLVSTAD